MTNRLLLSCLLLTFVQLAGCALGTNMSTTQTAQPTVPLYGVHEIALTCSEPLDNPFRDAAISAEYVSPTGRKIRVEGFYYGDQQWRVRFVPREQGLWKWSAQMTGCKSQVASSGTMLCSGTAGRGFLKVSKKNPFRFEYEDGTPFYPIGIQTCNFLHPDFDGPNPASEGSRWRSVSTPEWLEAFKGAVNLVRTQFGQGRADGSCFCLIPAPPKKPKGQTQPTQPAPVKPIPIDQYDLEMALKLDQTYQLHRAAGISQILILYQDMSLWGPQENTTGAPCAFGNARDLVNYKNVKAPNMPQQEQYIRYIVARYGCYVDIWEIFNEDSYAPDDYLAHLAGVIRAADPYHHLLTTNYTRPNAAWSDLNTWHEYMGMPANEVDAHIVSQIAVLKSYGKPVQNTEFGNQGKLPNVDPVKWRIAVWTAFMQESGLLFWGMSGNQTQGRKTGTGNSNAYIGPDSRQHFRVFHQLTGDLPVDMRPVPSGFTGHTDIRLYALCDARQGILYVHHFQDHTMPCPPQKVMMQTGPGLWRVQWFDPSDGKEVMTTDVSNLQQYIHIQTPPVTVDLVARLKRLGPPTPPTLAAEPD